MIDDDLICGAPAAARFIGLAISTLAKLRCQGGSPVFIKAGRKILYRRRDLITWLNTRRVRNTGEASQSLPRRLTDPLVSSSVPNENSPSERRDHAWFRQNG